MRRLTTALVAAGLLGAGGCAVGQTPAADSPESAAGLARPSRPIAIFGHLGGDPRAAVEILGGRVHPGVPTVERQVHDGTLITLTVAPARPGWNLVRVDTAEPDGHTHGHGGAVTVGTPARLVPATPRPGTGGTWARVRLPAGAPTVYAGHGPEHRVPFPVDTGPSSETTAPTVPRADGPECTAAAALRAMVETLADRGVPVLALLADGSPRGREARSLVLHTATARGLRVVDA